MIVAVKRGILLSSPDFTVAKCSKIFCVCKNLYLLNFFILPFAKVIPRKTYFWPWAFAKVCTCKKYVPAKFVPTKLSTINKVNVCVFSFFDGGGGPQLQLYITHMGVIRLSVAMVFEGGIKILEICYTYFLNGPQVYLLYVWLS